MTEQQLAERLQPIFEHLHQNPEESWNEVETTAYLVKFLQDEGIQLHTFENMTGLYVDIGKGIPKVGFRTDIDALWQEVDGIFQANHSCGHDGHMTVALGTVLLLKELEPTLPGAIRILFQPAEEKAQGAKALVELQDDTYAPALHHGATKIFTGEIHGVEAHGARPEEGKNAIEIAAALVDGLKKIWINPTEPASIKMTQVQAGGRAANIIPGNATFSIDARAGKNETMDALTNGFERVVKAVSTLYDVPIHYQLDASIAAAKVDDTAKEIMKQAIIDVVGEEKCAPEIVTPGGEDFHFYAYSNPQLQTTMLGLGCGVKPGLHHPKMTFNQQHLPTGAKIVARALVLALQQVKVSGNK